MRPDRNELFEDLYNYYPRVLAFLIKLGFKREDAEDIAQQVFTRVYMGMDAYRGESKVAFLEQITRRLVFNDTRDKRAQKRKGTHVALNDIVEPQDTSTDPPDRVIEGKEAVERLHKAIEQLPPKERTAIRLQLSGLSCENMAETLHISVPALKSRLNVARKRLKEILGDSDDS